MLRIQQESVLTKTRRFFKKNDVFFKITLLLFLGSGAAYAFLYGNALLKLITLLALGVLIMSFVSNYILNFLTSKGYKLADALNEILYVFLGVPILLIAIGYLPLSIYISFFSPDNNEWLIPLLTGIMIAVQIAAFIMILRGRSKEKGKNIFGYLKYIFDFKRRAEEQRIFQEQTDHIDQFYSEMEKVKDKVDTTMMKSTVGFNEFDWKAGRGIKKEERTEIVCWNCKEPNPNNAIVCSKCGISLKNKQ